MPLPMGPIPKRVIDAYLRRTTTCRHVRPRASCMNVNCRYAAAFERVTRARRRGLRIGTIAVRADAFRSIFEPNVMVFSAPLVRCRMDTLYGVGHVRTGAGA